MITAIVKIELEWSNLEVVKREYEFGTINELEDFLSYNRSYIKEISFTGKIKIEEN